MRKGKCFLHQWKCALYALCLLCDLCLADNQGLQRRFMWKHMEGTMAGIKDMIGDFLPMAPTTPNTDLAATTTTRIKYIIKKPIPMKIIKIRSPHKVTKIIKMQPTVQKSNKQINYMTETYTNNNNNNNNKKYHELESAAEAFAIGKQHETTKPSPMSKLHTNIMLDASDSTAAKEIEAEHSHNVPDYSFAASTHNGYEVVEHIDEDSIDYNRIVFPTLMPYSSTVLESENQSFTELPLKSSTTTTQLPTTMLRNKNTLNNHDLTDNNSWLPLFGSTTTSIRPKGFWRHEKRPVNRDDHKVVATTSSSVTTSGDKPRTKKRNKNIFSYQPQPKPQHHHEEEVDEQETEVKRGKNKRGSIKFGDKINFN